MRRFLPSLLLSCAMGVALMGCSSTPNNPSYNFDTAKTPSDYAKCIYPKWQQIKPDTTMTESKGHYKLLISGKIASDEILEVYKGNPKTRVFLYQRAPLSSAFGRNALEKAVRDCL
jgi:hypothetical protein